MCQCGCTEGLDGKRFPGPDGIVYVLEIYAGCSECGTPAGVAVKRYEDTEEQRFWFQDHPEGQFTNYRGEPQKTGDGCSEFVQAIVDPEDVLIKLKEGADGVTVMLDGDEYTFAEYLDDFGDEAIRDGICKTLADFDRGQPVSETKEQP